ncbi:hypothetical protein GJ496_004689 [Pomphorhynchus laevis]|nr:hypothetical protein GJ496_004689 [Pomphorhynchus laevis]
MTKGSDTLLLFIILVSLFIVLTSVYALVSRLFTYCRQRRNTTRRRNMVRSSLQNSVINSSNPPVYVNVENANATASTTEDIRSADHERHRNSSFVNFFKRHRQLVTNVGIVGVPTANSSIPPLPPPEYTDLYPKKVNVNLQTDHTNQFESNNSDVNQGRRIIQSSLSYPNEQRSSRSNEDSSLVHHSSRKSHQFYKSIFKKNSPVEENANQDSC